MIEQPEGLPKTPQHVFEVLNDGVVMELQTEGQPIRIKVRKIAQGRLSELSQAMGNMSDETGEAACYLGLSLEAFEALKLTDESFDAVMQEGRRLNFTRFKNYLARRVELMALSNQMPQSLMDAAAQAVVKLQATSTPGPSK